MEKEHLIEVIHNEDGTMDMRSNKNLYKNCYLKSYTMPSGNGIVTQDIDITYSE
jgi:hypothetical protein